jgi:hypothetical protein
MGLLTIGFVLSGCLGVKSYVDPALPPLAIPQLPKVAAPRPVTVLFEFRTQGSANTAGTSGLSGRVIAAVAQSGIFTRISSTVGDGEGAILKVSINDAGDTGSAAAKGVATGLTFGLAGSVVTDNYECTAAYTLDGKTTETTVHHAIHTTIGNHSAPAGMKPLVPQDAINEVVDQLVWHALSQLNDQGAFVGAGT